MIFIFIFAIWVSTLHEKDFPGPHKPIPAPMTWEFYRPRWGIQTNSATDYQILLRAYNSKTWVLLPEHYNSTLSASLVIMQVDVERHLYFDVMKAVADSLNTKRKDAP